MLYVLHCIAGGFYCDRVSRNFHERIAKASLVPYILPPSSHLFNPGNLIHFASHQRLDCRSGLIFGAFHEDAAVVALWIFGKFEQSDFIVRERCRTVCFNLDSVDPDTAGSATVGQVGSGSGLLDIKTCIFF